MNRDVIFAFIGGAVVGTASTLAIMQRMGYANLNKEYTRLSEERERYSGERDAELTLEDKPSFTTSKTSDTRKVRYDHLKEKPPLEELVAKVMVDSEEETEDDTDGDPDPGLAYVDQYDESDREYGTVISQVKGRRKDQLIFLVPEECAGELYLLEELRYYAGDDTLADITDSPVEDPLSVIGDSLGMFGQCGETEDMMFIRNCTLGVEYEVTRVESRWADQMYSYNEDEIPEDRMVKKTKMPRREDDE